jgi:serine/threonine-protein kinase
MPEGQSHFKTFILKLRKRHIVETLAAFIGGGWLILEFVDRLLVAHYHFPDETIDLTFITILAALICTILWRWFRGTEKRPGNVKIEVLLVPLIILTALCIDLNIVFDIAGFSGKRLLVGITALCLGIAWIIFKSLQWAASTPESSKKEARAVYPSMSAVVKDLELQNSIAVLPFVDMSPQKDQEYFCDGMTEELINRLTNIRELRVPARTSAFMFKGKAEDVREIGRKLGVRTVLEGSIRKAGNQLRVTAQLVNISDGFHLWSETYNRELKDVFNTWDEIALTIADKLKLTLLGDERANLTKRYTENIEAYNLYLRGKTFYLLASLEGYEKAIECFEQALQKDPDFALAYSGLADVYFLLPFFGTLPPTEGIPKSKKYLEKALDIDDNLAEAHSTLGRIIAFYDWDWTGAEREFKRALELNPNSSLSHGHYSDFLTVSKRQEEAISEAKQARKLDPLSVALSIAVGEALFFAGQFDKSIEDFKKTIIMDPNDYYAHSHLGLAYAGKSMMKESMAEYKKALELSSGDPVVAWLLSDAHYRTGAKAESDKLFDGLKERAKREYVPPFYFFALYKGRGDLNQAFNWLEKACEDRDLWLPYGLVWPDDAYRIPYDQKSAELLKKVGLI